MKTCSHCHQEKDESEFYVHRAMKDGRLSKCKECCKKENTANRQIKREQYSSYEHERNKQRREYMHDQQRKHRAANPEKYKARMAVSNAIRDGRLVRRPCRICGKKAQAHHQDYSKPLEVDWLCFRCHREIEHGQVVVAIGHEQ